MTIETHERNTRAMEIQKQNLKMENERLFIVRTKLKPGQALRGRPAGSVARPIRKIPIATPSGPAPDPNQSR